MTELTRGTVSRGISKHHRYFWIEEATGREIFGHPSNCDFPGSHLDCLLKPGLKVEFQIVTSHTHPGTFRAIDIRPIDSPYEDTDQTEVSTINYWMGSWGMAVRPCGCELFVPSSRVVTLGVETIRPGSEIRHKIIMDDDQKRPGKQRPIATEIEIFIPQTT